MDPDIKKILENFFLKISARRHKYLYSGITGRDDICMCGTFLDSEFGPSVFRFGVSFLRLKDPTIKKVICEFLSLFINDIENTTVILDIGVLTTLLKKAKWDMNNITWYCDRLVKDTVYGLCLSDPKGKPVKISHRYSFFYSKIKLKNIYNEFLNTILNPMCVENSFCYPYTAINKEPIQNIHIPLDKLPSMLGDTYLSDIRIPLIYGIDLLVPSSFLEKSEIKFSGLIFWLYSKQCLRYCFATITEHIDVFASRSMLYLFPSTDITNKKKVVL